MKHKPMSAEEMRAKLEAARTGHSTVNPTSAKCPLCNKKVALVPSPFGPQNRHKDNDGNEYHVVTLTRLGIRAFTVKV